MDSNLSYFSLPFVDCADLDFGKIRGQECDYDDLHPTLPSHGSLLGADDDVLAQFLSGDDPLEEPDLNGPTTLHCEICKKQFDNAKKYYGHLRVHSKDNLWICDKCPDEKFSNKQQLMKHTLTHQPLEKVWRCPQCELSFEALWRLQQHLFAKHLDYRPHKCELCPKTFHKLSDLDKHKNVHEEKKNHMCSVCKTKFVDKSNLKRHMLTHGTEKPYSCTGCGRRFKQVASMRRHSVNCPKNQAEPKKSYRNNYCRVCGLTFQYKSSLLEHCVREHSTNPSQPPPQPPKEDKSNQLHVDTNRTVDNIVDDILSAEDDYMTMSTQNELINYPTEVNQDNLMQIELLKEMNQINNMHILDDELLYNDIDLDSFQTMCNNIDYERNELFDLNDARSLDQDIMSALVRGIDQDKDELPKEFLDPPEMNSKVNEFLVDPPVSVNECATIFESDVDLEASTNLAANLNQLIGENTVQYIATENDDTFIISLNSEIDAEQLTDMLNIGVDTKSCQKPGFDLPDAEVIPNVEPKRDEIECKKDMETKKKKGKTRIMYVCLKCKKIFKTKNNYTSHRGTHDEDLKQFKCKVCLELFSYKSSLNKHTRQKHTPVVRTAHTCHICDKNYNHAWQLKHHIDRDHKLLQPYQCKEKDCGKMFFKKCDLVTHTRFHTGEKPYVCNNCKRGFKTTSHLARHVKNVNCTKLAQGNYKDTKTTNNMLVMSENSKRDFNQAKPLISTTPSSKNEARDVKTFLEISHNSKTEENVINTTNNSRCLLVTPLISKIEDNKTRNSKSFLEKSDLKIKENVKANTVKSARSLLVPLTSKIEDNAKTFLEIRQNSKIEENLKTNTIKNAARSLIVTPLNSKIEENSAKKFFLKIEKIPPRSATTPVNFKINSVVS